MKQFYFLSMLMFVGIAQAQIVNIPDPVLKNKLVTEICASFTDTGNFTNNVDTNGDGEIQLSEALAVKQLFVSGALTSCVGLEAFTSVKRLLLQSTGLADFSPISGLTALEYLSLYNAAAATLDTSQMANLQTFNGQNGLWQTLDFSQTKVVTFDVNGCNQLTYLNLKNGYLSSCQYGPDDGCTQWFLLTNLKYVCRDEGELTIQTPGYAPLPWGVINSYCSVAPGGDYNTITGHLTVNCGNGNYPMPGVALTTIEGSAGSNSVYTDWLGQYSYFMGNGPVSVTPQIPGSPYFTLTPASFSTTFSSLNNNVTADFCLNANGVHPDLEISILPNGPARPGFDADYVVVVKNKGTEVQSGTFAVTFDDALTDFVSASGSGVQSGNQISWTFSNVVPFANQVVNFKLNVNSPMETPAVNIGDTLDFNATVTAGSDETPADNIFGFKQVVLGSYDPNDKAVSKVAVLPSGLDEYLYYTIRFQNTGNFAAENVVIKDVLSANLDTSTLEIVATSHNGHRNLKPGNILEFYFEGINLPAESVNEPASHGYVIYKIKPKSTLVLNDQITNKAEIYFDFNFPIITNTVTTTITSLNAGEVLESAFALFPNPTANTFSIQANTTINSVAIYNMLGQLVKTANGPTTIDVSELSAGSYLIQIVSDKGKATKKLIKI
ncbi:hypothetical protein FLLO111716_01390 [Flavobacterium longum]|uniref:DUF7619 domain-containing protein n=1 Tax=Flavobacterium longum TaxID=1299340 RepID=UPI0039E9FB27